MTTAAPSPEIFLAQQDRKIGKLISIFGNADIGTEKRQPFDALARAVIGQQLSTAATGSIVNRIVSIHGKRPFKPARFLALGSDRLRACGISNSKIRTIAGIAEACIAGDISHKALERLDDDEVVRKLTAYWGVGNWTAEIFMMFGLNRLDALALGDGGLIRAHRILYPNSKSLETTAHKWRPYRAVAAWYLWQFLDNLDCHREVRPLNRYTTRQATTRLQEATMEMKKINSGRLRAIGYDSRARILQVQLDDGSMLQYGGVGEDTWRRLGSSGAAWSFYRDNIEEEFAARRVSGGAPAGRNPLDDLFRKS